ncbi:MAG: hypothetical protein PHH06_02030 [Candidatus Gracilibacteria bacterium]|nr:hypothetical protein [Candidatus Gracilibacteria bacterium]
MKKYIILVTLLFLAVSCDTNLQDNYNFGELDSQSTGSLQNGRENGKNIPDTNTGNINNGNTNSGLIDNPEVQQIDTLSELYNNVEIKYDVAFYSQFPLSGTGKYAEPYQNFCEEASLLNVYYYYMGETPSKDAYIEDLMKIKNIEDKLFGENGYRDTALTESLVSLLFFQNEEYLDDFLNAESEQVKEEILENILIINAQNGGVSGIIENFPRNNLSQEELNQRIYDMILGSLVDGNLVIVPVYGKGLENPYFSAGGPVYHNFVITGVTGREIYEGEFITQEVGISLGADFKYNKEVVLENIYDFDRTLYPDSFTDGEQRILILFKTDTIRDMRK